MKAYLTKDSDNVINMWTLRPRFDKHMFSKGWTWTGCSVSPIWHNVPWQVLWELGIDSTKMGSKCYEVELNIIANPIIDVTVESSDKTQEIKSEDATRA